MPIVTSTVCGSIGPRSNRLRSTLCTRDIQLMSLKFELKKTFMRCCASGISLRTDVLSSTQVFAVGMLIGTECVRWRRSGVMSIESDYLIGHSRSKTLALLKIEEDNVLRRCGLPITFNHDTLSDDSEVGEADIRGLPDEPLLMRIGLRGLAKPDFPFTKVSDLNFARLFNALWHEERHIDQTFGVAQRSGNDGFSMACSLVSAIHNPMFFKRNQLLFLCEFDARKVAFQHTVNVFSRNFGTETATAVVLDGFNSGYLGRNAIYDNRKCATLSDVDQAFDDSFAYIKRRVKYYAPDTERSDDEIALALHLFDDDDPRWRYFRGAFYGVSSGFDQEVMMAAVHLYLHPDFAQYYGAFDGSGISPETVFGRSFPESRECILRRLPECYLSSEDRDFLSGGHVVVPPGRDTSDLDQAVESNTRCDAGPGPDYDIS